MTLLKEIIVCQRLCGLPSRRLPSKHDLDSVGRSYPLNSWIMKAGGYRKVHYPGCRVHMSAQLAKGAIIRHVFASSSAFLCLVPHAVELELEFVWIITNEQSLYTHCHAV